MINAWIKRNLKGDPIIWTITILLALMGVLAVYSAANSRSHGGSTTKVLFDHLLLIFLSLVATWLAHNLNYKYYSRLSRFALLMSVPLLLYTFFFGKEVNDASRWLEIPLIGKTFQTSDLAKMALIANLAAMLAKRQKDIADFNKVLKPILIWCGVICGMIALSDLSTALQLFVTCLVIMFIGRVPLRQLFMVMAVGGVAVFIALWAGQRLPTAMNRIDHWWDVVTNEATPETMKIDQYQVYMANIAIAKGGFMGEGIAQSEAASQLPYNYSDYIFARLVGEQGSKIALVLLFLYLALLYRGMKVASRTDRAFGGLLSVGLSLSLVIQAVTHMAVNVGLAPATGQPLPLVSMGGTSLLFTGLSIGIILSVSRGDLEETIQPKPVATDEGE